MIFSLQSEWQKYYRFFMAEKSFKSAILAFKFFDFRKTLTQVVTYNYPLDDEMSVIGC